LVASYIRCAACSRTIPERADDIVLTRRDGTEKRFYCTGCYDAAEEAILAEGKLRVWTITYGPAQEEAA
jgi:hypothetical protein